MSNDTKGYHSGDDCPKCAKTKGGIIEIRNYIPPSKGKYAQCTRCSWNTAR